MNKWFDIHSHILPCVDDGSVSLEQSRNMLKIAYDQGIRTIFATPHYSVGCVNMELNILKKQYSLVKNIAKEISPNLEVMLGHELYYSEDIINHLRKGQALTLNGTRYVLVEFHRKENYENIKIGLHRLLIYGYFPIIAHIERYECLRDNLENVEELIDLGSYTQMNTSSLTGRENKVQKKFCKALIEHEMLHFLGSNCHNDYARDPYIKKGLIYLKRRFGEKLINRLLIDNPMTLLKNEYIYY